LAATLDIPFMALLMLRNGHGNLRIAMNFCMLKTRIGVASWPLVMVRDRLLCGDRSGSGVLLFFG
jgi:hypothetical protein